MTTTEELERAISGYTGTEHYYRHPLNRHVTYSDGAKQFAEVAGAYWLLDILATELPDIVNEHEIVFITANVADSGAILEARRDKGEPALWSKHITLTDLPDGEWSIWMGTGGPEGTQVIFLPSEY